VAIAIPLGRQAPERSLVSPRVAGAAGLAYVVAAGVESMELLRAPLPGAPAAEIRAAYADGALAAATAIAGVLSLLCYAAFALLLAPRVRHSGVALAAGLAGPALALGGIAASLPLVVGADADATAAADLQRTLRHLAAPCMAVFLWCAGCAVPRPLAIAGRTLAVPLAMAPLAGHVPALAAFGLDALWIWLAGLWLLGAGAPPAVLVRRSAFLMLVVAAGLVGVALLLVPGAAGAFFAWGLAPDPLAAFAGGVYVGSAVVYAAALRAPWRQARPLVAAAVVLSVSVLAATLAHLEVLDFQRLQAWAWVVLFAAFAVTTIALLLIGGDAGAPRGATLPAAVRALLAAVALGLGAVALRLWIDPGALPDLGGRFAGSWAALLAVLAGWAAVANRRAEARLPGLALVALPAGALAGAARALPGEPAYVGGLVLLVCCGAAVLRASRAA
jgi:hypothetical protein